jgi:hypothetical protein
MGRQLGLEVLVEGTVQKAGEQVSVTARLVDVHTGRLIWAENYDYPAANLDQIQTEAAREVAAQVAAHLAIHGRFLRSDRRFHNEKRSRRFRAGIPKGNRSSFRAALGRCWC